jgi:hypothetical protein
MRGKLTKAELIQRVERLMSGRCADEKEMNALLREIAQSVPCPRSHIPDFIFNSKDDANAETIVARILDYRPKPIQL